MPDKSSCLNPHLKAAQGTLAIQKFPNESDVAKYVKEYFDSKYGPNWHCIVGRHFAHFGSHHAESYSFVHIGQVAVLVYRMD